MVISRSGGGFGPPATATPAPVNGLTFPSNLAAGSDIRLVWDGSILLPRSAHTALWKQNYTAQSSYYACVWSAHNTGTFGSDTYEFGTHPYPTATGAVDANGQNTDVTSQSGSVHYFEVAGLGGHDYLASPGGSGVLVTKGQWYAHARSVGTSGSNLVHKFYLDQINNPSQVISQSILSSNLAAAGSTPAFYIGASDWRSGQGGATSNDETPSGVIRGIQLYNAELTSGQIAALSALDTDAAVLSYCTANSITSLWYLNMNPTPSDVTDKSGNGRNPTWANSNRPTLYTG